MASRNIKNFELRLRKTGIIVIIAGMSVLLCIAFLLGVDVGKNIDTHPEKISSFPKKVLALISRPATIDPAQNLVNDRNSQEQSEDTEKIDLTFHQALTGKRSMAEEKALAEKKQVVEAPQPEVKLKENTEEKKLSGAESTAVTKEITKPDEKNKLETQKQEGENKKQETPSSATKPKKRYIVHAASFQEKGKAYQLNKKIAALGFDPKIIPVEIKSKGTWYRVIVSGFDNKAQAQFAADKISKKTGSNCIIRTVETGEKKAP